MFDIKDDSPTPFYMQAFLQWKRITGKHHGKEEWKRICGKYLEKDVYTVLRYAERNLRHFPKISLEVFSKLLADAQEDPIASGIEANHSAVAVADEISRHGYDVHEAYVQVLRWRYAEILAYLYGEHQDLWHAMPDLWEFSIEWYTVIHLRRGATVTTFSPKQLKFREYIRSVLNTLPGKPTHRTEDIWQGCIKAVYGK